MRRVLRLATPYRLAALCKCTQSHSPNAGRKSSTKRFTQSKCNSVGESQTLSNTQSSSLPNSLERQLIARIKASGPVTLAEYMMEVLTNPVSGYYTTSNEIFGKKGDYVTSPEISQMYGEMLAVWLINEWQNLGSPVPLQLVELGPGRGNLARDMLRVFNTVCPKTELSLHLVELSPHLKSVQAKTLDVQLDEEKKDNVGASQSGRTQCGRVVHWYDTVDMVPEAFSLIVANEFFDALPVHQFRKTENGWREVLIDVASIDNGDVAASDGRRHLRFIIARGRTPVSFFADSIPSDLDVIEICPKALMLMQQLALRVNIDGGIALICDYGENTINGDTVRAYRNHAAVHVLDEPGCADVTADVNFESLREMALKTEALAYGPVTQKEFLKACGIDLRLASLQESMPNEVDHLNSSYKVLMDDMGDRFKFLSVFPTGAKVIHDRIPPTGMGISLKPNKK